MCNFHQEGVFLSKILDCDGENVRLFIRGGHCFERLRLCSADMTTIPLNTRSYNGDWLDTDIMEAIAKSKGIVI